MLSTEPLSQPLCRVRINRRVGRTDLTETVIVRPAGEHPVEATHPICGVHPSIPGSGLRTDLAANALNAFLAGSGTDISPRSLLAEVVSNTISKKRKRFLWTAHTSGLVIIHRQFQLRHYRRDRRQHIRCRGLAEDDKVVRVIDNHRAKAPGMAQRLPTENEPTQGDVARKGRDRRTLGCALPLLACSRRANRAASTIHLLRRHLQPGLEQFEHVSIADATGKARHQLGMGNFAKIVRPVPIHHLMMPGVQESVNGVGMHYNPQNRITG